MYSPCSRATPVSISSYERFCVYGSHRAVAATSVYFVVVISILPLKHASTTVVSTSHHPYPRPLCSLSFSPACSAFTSHRKNSAASLRALTVKRSLLDRVTSFTN